MAVDPAAVQRAWEMGDLLTDTFTIYSRDATGRATVVEYADVPCRVSTSNFRDAGSAQDRAELAQVRTLYWIAAVPLLPDQQVELNNDGRRWNVRPETIRTIQMPDGGLHHNEADLLGSSRPPAPTPR